MPDIQLLALEMINILFQDEKYTEALEGLRLLRKGDKRKEFRRMIDGLIRIIVEKQLEAKDSQGPTKV